MKLKLNLLIISIVFIISGCDNEKIFINDQNVTIQQSRLQLLESDNPIIKEIMGNEIPVVKTKSVNKGICWENPWLLQYDTKQRIAFEVETDKQFEEKRLIYVKNGEKYSSYYIERIYLGNKIKPNEAPAAEFIINFSGMLKVYSEKNTLVYILYYWDNKIIKTVDIVQETNRFRTTKSDDPNTLSVALDEVVVVAEDLSHGGESVWTTIPNYTTPNSNIEAGSNNSGITNSNSFSNGNSSSDPSQGIGEVGNEKTLEQIAREQIDYLKKYGEPELAAVFESLLSDKTLTMEDVFNIYVAIDNACLKLQAQYAQAIYGAFAESIKPILEITLFNLSGKTALVLLNNIIKKGIAIFEVSKVGTTVLGHYPEYMNLANKIRARRFSIPTNIWDSMGESERWLANQKFLNRMIIRGDRIRLATPIHKVRPDSYYHRELNYLFDKGYKPSSNGLYMVK